MAQGLYRLGPVRLTVLPHDGGPAYPPDGADKHQGPRLYRTVQFYLMMEGQLTLLTEPTNTRAPGCRPRQFYLM